MKLVIDESVATKWYVRKAGMAKALRLRLDYHTGRHALLAPDTLFIDCTNLLIQAERSGTLGPGEASDGITDLISAGITLHPSEALLQRAAEIAFTARLTASAGLYIALAEREQCQLLTADAKMVRNTWKHFPFVLSFDAWP